MKPVHFPTAEAFRRWLEKNHASASDLWVAFYKKAAGKSGMTYQEAVDEALCFGWIDGIIKRLDSEQFTHRFTSNAHERLEQRQRAKSGATHCGR